MNITSFLIYCVIVTFTPGPTNIVIFSSVQNFGTKKTMPFVYGAVIAIGFLLAASALLNSVLMTVVPKIINIMQILGSCYMLYLAYQIYKMNVPGANVQQSVHFISGLLMQFLNPKVILFTMTVFPSFILPYYTSPLALSIFVLIVTTIAFSALITRVLFGTVLKGFLQKYQKASNTIMALFLVYSAVMVSGILEFLRG